MAYGAFALTRLYDEELNDSKLMQEDQEDADWTDESDGKEEDWEKLSTYRIPVGEFITYNLLWYIPAQEQAGDERR